MFPLLVTLLVACGDASAPVAPVPAPTADAVPAGSEVAALAAIADEIEAAPADADAILARHGTTREAFEAALYDVALDPAKAKEYAAARR